MNRLEHLHALHDSSETYDICIIGGGATGLGAAVDAAARGHSVALIERGDFAHGTSSRSTKLIHGGLRYLKQGNIALVMEALRERGRLARNAPHLVHDLAFVIPNYKWWEGPYYGLGMKMYDQLAGKLGLGPSERLSKEETIRAIPTIEPDGLVGGVIYHDGQFDDARLAIHLAMTAAGLGARLANRVRCRGLIKERGIIRGVEAEDLESGESFTIRARCVINATGVFVDQVRAMDEPESKPMIGFSQGVHVVLPREFLPGDAAIMVPKMKDGRVLFAVPWHDRVILGTTDTPRPEASLEPVPLPEEIDFIMKHAACYLTRDPSRADILSVFAGLRPVIGPDQEGKAVEMAHEHTTRISAAGLVSITGGKWTTYRKMAEDVVDHAEMVAGLDAMRCITDTLQVHAASRERAPDGPLRVYGSDASLIEDLKEPEKVHPLLPLTRAEVRWHAREEMALHVEDVLSRRSRSLLLDARASMEAAPVVAAILAEELRRDAAWREREVAAYRQLAAGYLAPEEVRPEP
ncbi:MAG: FAD-dependent oxidoreductase [Akkermansiaceae bacterium]|nr:FAD-dependent oxidoreductase [Akkermansiaceae bacterium]